MQEQLQNVENLLKSGHFSDANHLLNDQLIDDPDNIEVKYWIAVSAKMMGDFKKAEKYFQSVIKSNPNHDKAFYGLGLIYEANGDVPEALKLFKKVYTINPSHQPTIKKLKEYQVEIQDKNKIPEKHKDEYVILEKLLSEGKWEKADKETTKILHKMAAKKNNFFIKDIECSDLKAINNLWLKYSKNRFGFSIQKKIYLSHGGLLESGKHDLTVFGWYLKKIFWYKTKNVGFKKMGGALIGKRKLIYDLSSPIGYLPGNWILPDKSLIFDFKKDSLWTVIYSFIVSVVFIGGILGLIGGLIAQEAGVVIGIILGLLVGIQIPLSYIRYNKQKKKVKRIQQRIVAMFCRVHECEL